MNKAILTTLKTFSHQLQNLKVCQDFIDYRDEAAATYKTYGRPIEKIRQNCDYLWLEWKLIQLGLVTPSDCLEFDCSLPECNDVKLELKGIEGKYFNIHPTTASGYGGANWLEKNIKGKNFDYMVFWQFAECPAEALKVGDEVSVHVASVESGDEIWNNKRKSVHEVGGFWYAPKNLIRRS